MTRTPRPTPDTSASKALRAALETRYQWPEWLVERELTLGRRRIDAVAVRLWGGGGYRTLGFEIKVSRSDWLRELKDWDKQQGAVAAVDQLYVVATKGVVQPGELPKGWGLLELAGTSLRLKVQPGEPTGDQRTFPRELLARLAEKLVWRERESRGELRDEIKAELLPDLKRDLERQYSAVSAKAVQYDALLTAVGLQDRYGHLEPAQWVACAHALSQAIGRIPRAYELDSAPLLLAELGKRLTEVSTEIHAALGGWRSLVAAAERAPTT